MGLLSWNRRPWSGRHKVLPDTRRTTLLSRTPFNKWSNWRIAQCPQYLGNKIAAATAAAAMELRERNCGKAFRIPLETKLTPPPSWLQASTLCSSSPPSEVSRAFFHELV